MAACGGEAMQDGWVGLLRIHFVTLVFSYQLSVTTVQKKIGYRELP